MTTEMLERRRDNQQWILDWLVKTTGKVQNFANDERQLPSSVKSYRMIPRVLYKKASHFEEIARAAEEHGHLHTASALYMKACDEYREAQHAIFEDDNAEKIFLHQKHMDCFDRAVACSTAPIETVEIPWEGVTIQARWHPLPDRRRAPAVLFIPGMDMTKEAFPTPLSNPFHRRGMHVLSIDGPGQGISNIRKIRVGADNYERAASAAIDWLQAQPEVDDSKLAACGASFGTHWGSRLAAIDPRVKAIATAHAVYGPKTAIFEEASPRFKQMFMYMAGIHDEDAFDEMVRQMDNVPDGPKIRCATLMIVGEYDPLCHLEDAVRFFEEIAGPKELWVFENEFHRVSQKEGLAGLEIYHFEADWLRDALNGKLPAEHRAVRLIRQSEGPAVYTEANQSLLLPGRGSTPPLCADDRR